MRPAAFFCAVVPPWLELDRELEEPDFFPPRLDAPGELAILAARSLDIPFSLSFSYCFSFLTFADLLGMRPPFRSYERFFAVAFPPLAPAARFLAVELLRLAVERDALRDVPEVDREVAGFARDVVDFAFEAVGFARDVVDFAFEAVGFARDAVDFAFEVADLARDVVAAFARDADDFAFEVADLARDDVAAFAREVVPPVERFAAVVRPPLLPAAFFCAVEALRLVVDRDRLVPLDLRGVAARTRDIPSSPRAASV